MNINIKGLTRKEKAKFNKIEETSSGFFISEILKKRRIYPFYY